jgi:hypothetical protein
VRSSGSVVAAGLFYRRKVFPYWQPVNLRGLTGKAAFFAVFFLNWKKEVLL